MQIKPVKNLSSQCTKNYATEEIFLDYILSNWFVSNLCISEKNIATRKLGLDLLVNCQSATFNWVLTATFSKIGTFVTYMYFLLHTDPHNVEYYQLNTLMIANKD